MFGFKPEKDVYLPETQNFDRSSPTILILTADKTEDLEFFYPFYRFIEAGYCVDVATPGGGSFKAKNGLGLQETLKLTEVDAEDYDMLFIPGGKAPAALKEEEAAINLVKSFATAVKPIAAICHGPQLLAEADVINGKRVAAWPEVKEEIHKAGGIFIDAETVEDGDFITARWPGDLPAYMNVVLKRLSCVKKNKSETCFDSAA